MTTHSECLKSRPETVGEVEPDGYNPNEVEHHEDGVGEGVLTAVVAITKNRKDERDGLD